MSIYNRMVLLIESTGLSRKSFLEQVGVSPGFLTQLNASPNSLSATTILKLKNIYPALNTEWLICGTPPMMLKGKKSEADDCDIIRVAISDEDGVLKCTHSYDDGVVRDAEVDYGDPESKILSIYMRDCAMEPTIRQGALLLLKRVNSSDIFRLTNDAVYMIEYKRGDIYVRRVVRTQGETLLKCDNPDRDKYPDIFLEYKHVAAICEVKGFFCNDLNNMHNRYYAEMDYIRAELLKIKDKLKM